MMWWIQRDNGDRIDGPFSTRDDALRARRWVEIVMKPETFWVLEEVMAFDEPTTDA